MFIGSAPGALKVRHKNLLIAKISQLVKLLKKSRDRLGRSDPLDITNMNFVTQVSSKQIFILLFAAVTLNAQPSFINLAAPCESLLPYHAQSFFAVLAGR